MFLKSGLPRRKPQVLVSEEGVDLNGGAVISGKAVLREAGSPLRGKDALEAAKMKRAASFLPRDHDDHHHFGGGGDGDRHHGGDGHHDGGHHNHKDNSDDGEDSGDDGDDDSGSDGSDDEDSDGSDDENSDEDSGSDDDDDDGDDDDNDDGDGGSDDNVGGDADGGGQVGNNISGVAPGNPAATTTPSQLPTVNNGGDGGQTSLPSSTPDTSTSPPPTTTAAPTIDPTPTSSIAVVTSPQSPGSTTEKTSTPSDNSPAGSALPDNTDNSGVLPSPTAVASKSSATSSLPGSSSTSSVSAGPTTLASTSAKQPSANIGAIVGSVLGILVLLVVVVLLLIRRRRRRLRREHWLLYANDSQNPFKTDGERNMADLTSTPRNPQLTLPEPVSPPSHRSWFSSLARLPQPPEQSRFSDPTETDVESTRSTTLSFLRPTDVDRDSNPSVPPYPSSSSPTRLSAGSTIASSASRWSFVDPFRDPPEKGQPRGSISSYPSQTLYLSGADDNRYTHLRQTDTVT